MSTLSSLGQQLIGQPLRPDLERNLDASQNPYDKLENPSGGISLAIAENELIWPELRERLTEIACTKPIPDWVAKYTDSCGAPELREQLADFASREISTLSSKPAVELDPAGFCVTSGATAAIELSAFLLGDPRAVAAVPVPTYGMYTTDLGRKAGVLRWDVAPSSSLRTSEGVQPLSVGDLDRTLEEVKAAGKQLSMLVLTQPDNPTGFIYTEQQLRDFADWCIAHEVHLCVNELYALSQLDVQHEELSALWGAEPAPYVSFLQLIEERQSPYLHWWYSFSKDFGISGFRCGLVYTRNEAFVEAFGSLAAPHTVSNHTQWLLAELLADKQWVAGHIRRNQQRLTESFARAYRLFSTKGITVNPSRGSLFLWIDLSPLMEAAGYDTEEDYWAWLYDTHGVLLTAPSGYGAKRAGFFRIVYSAVEPEVLEVAIGRILNASLEG